MDAQLFDCSLCFSSYNLSDRLPKILPACGHTFCTACLQAIINNKTPSPCPLDKTIFATQKTISHLPVNILLRQMIESRQQKTFCPTHGDEANLVCMTDKSRVCGLCAYVGKHKGHEFKLFSEIKEQANKKIEELENQIKIYETLIQDLQEKVTILKKEDMGEKFFQCLDEAFEEHEEEEKIEEPAFSVAKMDPFKDYITVRNGKEVFKCKQHIKLFTLNNNELHIQLWDQPFDNDPSELEDFDEITEVTLLFNKGPVLEEGSLVCNEVKKALEILMSKLKNVRLLIINFFFIDKRLLNVIHLTSCSFWNNAKIKKEFSLHGEGGYSEILTQSFNQMLPKVSNLKKLSLLLENKSYIDDAGLTSFLSHNTKILEELEYFELDLRFSIVTDESVTNLFTKPMKNVKTLRITLSGTQITDKSLEFFAKFFLPSIEKLEYLELSVYETSITDEGLIKVFANELGSIKKFIFNGFNTKIGDRSLEVFAQKLLPSMKILENLDLNFFHTCVTDKGLTSILTFQKQPIKDLKLNFGFNKITNLSIDVLAIKVIPAIPLLSGLDLKFNKDAVKDWGVIRRNVPNNTKLNIFTY